MGLQLLNAVQSFQLIVNETLIAYAYYYRLKIATIKKHFWLKRKLDVLFINFRFKTNIIKSTLLLVRIHYVFFVKKKERLRGDIGIQR